MTRRDRFKKQKKPRPENEVSEQEVQDFLDSIKNFKGYPRLRHLRSLMPSFSLVKINTLLRFLERSKKIIIDGDGYIIWTSESRPSEFTLADVANFKGDMSRYMERGAE